MKVGQRVLAQLSELSTKGKEQKEKTSVDLNCWYKNIVAFNISALFHRGCKNLSLSIKFYEPSISLSLLYSGTNNIDSLGFSEVWIPGEDGRQRKFFTYGTNYPMKTVISSKVTLLMWKMTGENPEVRSDKRKKREKKERKSENRREKKSEKDVQMLKLVEKTRTTFFKEIVKRLPQSKTVKRISQSRTGLSQKMLPSNHDLSPPLALPL